jgi:hypothetical protein
MSIRFVVLSLLFCCFIGTTGFGFGQHCFACETVNQASIRGPDGEHVSWDIECCPFVTLATCYD